MRDAGVPLTAQASGVPAKTVRRFLKDPMNIRISTLGRLAYGVNMPIGEFHLVDQAGYCTTCKGPPKDHYPLFPPTQAG